MTIRLGIPLVVLLLGRMACADVIILDKAPGSVFATGASFNAIAGGLTPGTFDIDETEPVILPHTAGLSAAFAPTGATAEHALVLDPDFTTGPAFFDSEFSAFSRSATAGQRSTAEGHIEFKVDKESIYTIDGFFSVDDVATSFGTVEMEVHLIDVTAGAGAPVTVFSSYQKSVATTDQLFMVGGADGDDTNLGFGAPSGLLDPTKHYAFKFLVNTLADVPTTDIATAFGKVTFSVTSVPEPGVFGLTCVGLLLGTSIRKRRR